MSACFRLQYLPSQESYNILIGTKWKFRQFWIRPWSKKKSRNSIKWRKKQLHFLPQKFPRANKKSSILDKCHNCNCRKLKLYRHLIQTMFSNSSKFDQDIYHRKKVMIIFVKPLKWKLPNFNSQYFTVYLTGNFPVNYTGVQKK